MPIEFISPVKKRISLYSDFHKDLTKNPITDDLALKKDEEAVKESIKNLILTDKGERLMQPTLGGNIKAMLFENNTPAVIKMIQEKVRTVIIENEPRAELIDVVVQSNIDSNNVQITVYFYVNNEQQPISVNVFLERTR